MSTEKLFWEDPYRTECEATVTEIDGRKVKLDKTVFFAESGGQKSDKGSIGGLGVEEAVKQGDKEDVIDIAYELAEEPSFQVGDTVEVEIDGERRKKLMKLHTATHLVYYFITEKLGRLDIKRSNIAPHKARIDFAYEGNLGEVLSEIEEKVNKFIKEGHEIRREPDSDNPDLWWWYCEDWEMPCGGTHVRSTEEIGEIELNRKTKGAGKERVEIFLS